MILIRECDWSVLIVICKTPHKMNCSNPPPENDKKDVFRSACHKRYYAENRERILARQKRWRAENPEAMKARSRRWYENNKERLASSRKNSRERLNDYWRSYYAKNKEQIKKRLREQRQRQIGQNITRFEVRDKGIEKLETRLVPSEHAVTLCEISTKILTLKIVYF